MLRRALLPYYISANFRFVRFLRQHFFCFICRFLSFYLLLRVLPDLRRQDNLSFYFLLAFFSFLRIRFLCFFSVSFVGLNIVLLHLLHLLMLLLLPVHSPTLLNFPRYDSIRFTFPAARLIYGVGLQQRWLHADLCVFLIVCYSFCFFYFILLGTERWAIFAVIWVMSMWLIVNLFHRPCVLCDCLQM